jgi:hypothetical protein
VSTPSSIGLLVSKQLLSAQGGYLMSSGEASVFELSPPVAWPACESGWGNGRRSRSSHSGSPSTQQGSRCFGTRLTQVSADSITWISWKALQISTIDGIIAETGVKRTDLLKIDVEGHELAVLDQSQMSQLGLGRGAALGAHVADRPKPLRWRHHAPSSSGAQHDR